MAQGHMTYVGGTITAAEWNQDIGANISVDVKAFDNATASFRQVQQALTPFAFPKETLIECRFCGQVNMAQHDKLYAGCGACGGPFDIAQFHFETPPMTEDFSARSTSPIPAPSYPMIDRADSGYWMFGAPEHHNCKCALVEITS